MTFALSDLENPLIKKGLAAQFAKRRARIVAGEKSLGWKVGLGAPAVLQRLDLAAPLIGFLMQRALVLSGGRVSFQGWTKPVAEPEVCVRMATDLTSGATPETTTAAIKEILPAIELADFEPFPTLDNLDTVLEGDIYQRHIILCGNTRPGASLDGLVSRVMRRNAEMARTTNLEAMTGNLLDIVAHVADVVDSFGERLSAGDVIITGSITPPIIIDPDEVELIHVIEPIGQVSVRFSE